MMPQQLFRSLLLASAFLFLPTHASFNYEVERRVEERVSDFMSGPMIVTGLLEKFLANGAFPNQLAVEDRDAFGTLAYSLLNEYKFDMIYYGTEDGIFVGFNSEVWGTYREPVNSGYIIDQEPDMQKYYRACVNRNTGEDENCTIAEEAQYIECIDGCALEICAVEETCPEDDIDCTRAQKWCPKYEIKKAMPGEAERMGYVPRTYHCHSPTGEFSQQPGRILQEDGASLGNCLYNDGVTLVNRSLSGDYVYCGGNGEVCDHVFVGGYRSRDYDPRYRSWYIKTKEVQKSNWAEPYAFFSNLDIGITYNTPFYTFDEDTRQQVFRGVFAVDYTFLDMAKFLQDSYGANSTAEETYVVIFEAEYPHAMVASSTGRSAASKVLKENPTQPCPDDASDQNKCDVRRVKMEELYGQPGDDILRTSFQEQAKKGYPRTLVEARLSEDAAPGSPAYVSQSTHYDSGDDDLKWIILVITPIERADNDALTTEDALFGLVCVIAGLGFLLCLLMFFAFFFKRKERAVILTDWRFTSAFLLGCALLNLSSYTFLGENTEELCIARMWSFHLLFAITMSPLFVKTYRLYRLVGTPNRNPSIISNPQAVAMTLPIVLIQIIILTVFTILDPPKPEDIILVDDTVVTQSVECTTKTEYFQWTILGFEVGIVLIGCVLAFITRNMDSGFGQSKELLFCIYNIAFIGLVVAVITFAMDIDQTGHIIITTIGIFCATVFSSAAFVVPRVIQTGQQQRALLPRRASNQPASPKPSNEKKKAARSVNFSENVDILDDGPERAVTGWSAVEEVEENGAAGMKHASSIGSLNDDDMWTQQDSSLGQMKQMAMPDETWRSTDLSDPTASRQSGSHLSDPSASSSPKKGGDPPPTSSMEEDEEYTTMEA